MSQVPGDEKQDERVAQGAQHSIIRFLERKTGDAPRVSLRDEESANVSAPIIDPSSKEKLSVPRGRGNYQLLGEIARGGMGVVMKAHDSDLGRDVAFKVLDKRLCERMDVVQRFVEEAQIGGQLQHPGIVPVYDLGIMADDRPYFTMKLVKGRTLATLLANRQTPSSDRGRMIDIFESICQTMAYAHSRGVIHRDLKPANIMVGAFGEVQVVDWGLAKVLVRGGTADEKVARKAHAEMTVLETVRSEGSGSGSDSMVGSILGTPSYMPPEQARGQVDRLDERTDIFALGALLCEILTGLPPYQGDRDEIIGAASLGETDGAFERLDECQADKALVKLAKQCLMAAPAARPGDAGVLAKRVHEYVVSVEERAQKAQVEAAAAGVRAEEERKARKLTLALGAAVVAIVLIGGGGWLFVQNERAAREREDSARVQAATEQQRELASKVDLALISASAFQGTERWDEAISAVERARALAEGGGAGSGLMASVESTAKDLDRSIAEAEERESLRSDTRRLLSELREVAQPNEMQGEAVKSEAFRDTFLAHGIDLESGELDAAAELLTRRGLGSEVAPALDAWGEARRDDWLAEQEETTGLSREELELPSVAAGDPTGALRLLDLAHLVDPDPQRAHLREALANRDLEELRYLATESFDGQSASSVALLATSLVRLGDQETALSVYRAGVEQHPDDFELLYLLARELTPGSESPGPTDELHEAAQCYRAALSLHPDNPWVRFYLGRIYRKLDEPERSLEQYQLASDLEPDNGRFRFRLAGVQSSLQLLEESRANYERTATKGDPDWVREWSRVALATLTLKQGDHEPVRDLVREAWDASVYEAAYYIRIYQLHPLVLLSGVTGEEDAILEALELFGQLFSSSAQARLILAEIIITTTKDLPPGRGGIPSFSATGEELLLSHAVDLAQQGLELDPEYVELWRILGRSLYYLGDPKGAISALTREAELLEEDDVINWLALAMAHHAFGDEDAARNEYARAITWMAANPTDERQRQFRAEASRVLGEE